MVQEMPKEGNKHLIEERKKHLSDKDLSSSPDFTSDFKKTFDKYKFVPKPQLDQHFLKDKKLIRRIVSLLEVQQNDIVFEVGAGIGTITKYIPKCKRVYAVELDEAAFNILKNELRHKNYVKCINDDAIRWINKLHFNKIISSTPFAICEPLLQKLFTTTYEKCVLLLPNKFVENILKGKTKLSLFTHAFLKINMDREVAPNAFEPVPKAKTILLTVEKKSCKEAEGLPLKMKIVRELFFQRDKKLKNALREMLIKFYGVTKNNAREIVRSTKISDALLNRCVENLNYHHYLKIIECMSVCKRPKGKSFQRHTGNITTKEY